jgi:hypothetical protein
MGSTVDDQRRYLLSLASQEEKRLIDYPNDWRPYEVINPAKDGQPFNHETAWELIVQLLIAVHPLTIIPQKKPPGAIAYQMIHCLDDGWDVYIKIRAGKRGYIYGRSFHYDERQL